MNWFCIESWFDVQLERRKASWCDIPWHGRPVGDRQAEEASPFRGNLSWNDQGISASNQEMTTIPKTGKSWCREHQICWCSSKEVKSRTAANFAAEGNFCGTERQGTRSQRRIWGRYQMTPFVLINDSENGSSHRGIGVTSETSDNTHTHWIGRCIEFMTDRIIMKWLARCTWTLTSPRNG